MTGGSLLAAICWSFLRATGIAALAVPVVELLWHATAAAAMRRTRILLVCLVVAPLFIPELLPGFHYRISASKWSAMIGLSATGSGVATELLYLLLQLCRAVSTGFLLRFLLPGPVRRSTSLHSWLLLRTDLKPERWFPGWIILNIHLRYRPLLLLWGLLTLRSFQEFETAALMQIDQAPVSWTVWMFDAIAAGLQQAEVIQRVMIPVSLQGGLLIILLMLVSGRRQQTWLQDSGPAVAREKLALTRTILAGWVLLLILYVALPVTGNLLSGVSGLRWILSSSGILRRTLSQLGVSLAFALSASAGALGTAALALNMSGRVRRRVLAWILLLPGLSGPLCTALLLQFLFQLPGLQAFWGTFVPLLAGLVLSSLPGAFLAVLLLQNRRNLSGVLTAELLGGANDHRRIVSGKLLWHLSDGRWLLAWLLLSQWCFWNVTISSMLHPPSIELVVTRLYNEMHFSRTEALLGLTLLSSITPCFVFALLMLVLRVRRWLVP